MPAYTPPSWRTCSAWLDLQRLADAEVDVADVLGLLQLVLGDLDGAPAFFVEKPFELHHGFDDVQGVEAAIIHELELAFLLV